jgi:O-antigen ligase
VLGSPYIVVALSQLAIAVLAITIATRFLGASLPSALLAAFLFNAVPLPSVSQGVQTPLFVHDLFVPFLLFVALVRGRFPRDRVLWVAAWAAVLWPAVGTVATALARGGVSEWLAFLFRRLGFVLFFATGLAGLPGVRVRAFMDTCVLVWIGMATMGILQYAGLTNTDIAYSGADVALPQSLLETAEAMRGFMGLNRGAVGVWGSAVAAYSVSMLALAGEGSLRYRTVYWCGTGLSLAVIAGSGSRTGAVAVAGGLGFVAVRLVMSPLRRRALRVLGLAGIGLAGVIFVADVLDADTVVRRFGAGRATLESGEQRAAVQGAAVSYVFSDPMATLVGMGQSTQQFSDLVGSRFSLAHTHSEYVEILWQAGLPGLALYCLLVFGIYTRMRTPRDPAAFPLALAGQAMLVSGAVSGFAVGSFFISSSRLATYSLLIAFVYGCVIRERREWAQQAARMPAGRIATRGAEGLLMRALAPLPTENAR